MGYPLKLPAHPARLGLSKLAREGIVQRVFLLGCSVAQVSSYSIAEEVPRVRRLGLKMASLSALHQRDPYRRC